MDLGSVALATAAGTAAAAYLNARLHLVKDVKTIVRTTWATKSAEKAAETGKQALFYLFEEQVEKFPNARAIWSREGCFTFAELYERVLQYAAWLQSLGVQPKQSVGLYAPNSCEFVFLTLAFSALGCFPAMINYNLANDSLVHCCKVSQTNILVVDVDEPGLQDRVEGSKKELEELGIRIVYLDKEVRHHVPTTTSARPPDSAREHMQGNHPWGLIYTSGTTGLPKAFPFESARMYVLATLHNFTTQATVTETQRDVWYDCMPYYHGTGGLMAMAALCSGNTLAIGRRFSATGFWRDIHDSGATGFIYVGETARYLLAQPPGPLDRGHQLRCMWGNGLRPDVWERFQERFAVPEVYEFFSSTEGVFTTGIWTRSGFGNKSVGHHGALVRALYHKTLVPVVLDPDTNDMFRDPKTGFARRAPYEKGGEIIVKLPSKEAWPGYFNNAEGTNKKFITDVFEKGDVFYRPGDALRRSPDGLWYFMDRLGDTFRWKGENVATAEVQEVMGTFPGMGEANVYGVEVPGAEGRAGCAAVMLDSHIRPEEFDWRGLAAFLRQKLPRYAVPIFVRIIGGTESTSMGTHNNKQNKVLLRQEGADPAQLGSKVPTGANDRLYWLHPASDKYEPFNPSDWEDVKSRKAKL